MGIWTKRNKGRKIMKPCRFAGNVAKLGPEHAGHPSEEINKMLQGSVSEK